MLRIRKDDKVMIMTGQDKGKVGRVMRVFPANDTILVEKLNIVKKARRKTQQNQQGGIVSMEAPVHISNVMLVDRNTEKPTKFSVSTLKDGSRVRISKNTGESF